MNTEVKLSLLCKNLSQSLVLGEKIGRLLKGGETIELSGDIGSGKTTLVKAIALGAGSYDQVSSPTFTLSKVYQANHLTLYHYDFYRLDDAGIMASELEESVNQPQAITLVEWADVVKGVLPKQRITIEIIPGEDQNHRLFKIKCASKYKYIVEGLK